MTLVDDTMEEFWSRLDPKTRARFKTASEVQNTKLPSASLEFNYCTGGGFPAGSMTTIYGNYSSSKTALLLESIGRWQKQGLWCAFADVEGTYDKAWAARLGVDNDKLILITKKSFGAINDEVTPLLKAGIDVFVLDSISMTIPEVFVEDGLLKEFDKQKQIGAASRSAGMLINSLHYTNEKTAIILISQTRTDMSGMHPMQKPTNGKAVEFGSSLMVKLTASPSEKEQIKGKVFIGDNIHELPVGREVKIDVVKNKVGPPNRTSKYKFYYAGEKVGIDNVDELVTMAKRFGIITGSAWLYYGEQKWHGQPALVEALESDKDLYHQIEADIDLMTTGEVKDE